MAYQIWGTDEYPMMFDKAANEHMSGPIAGEEIMKVLCSFARDKSLVPGGWTLELFSYFSELMLQDILDMVGESQREGHLHCAINTTFIALIPKSDQCHTF